MSSIYDKASLVLIPSGTKTSKVYSQKPTNGDGDFTFSRSTAATRVNASGNIEKETSNLLLQSNTFSNASWTKTNSSVTAGQSGYDGGSDAWQVDISASFAQVEQTISTSGVVTYSVYAKAGTLGFVRLRLDASTTAYADFDLASGTAGTTSGIITTSSTSLAGGWYRLSLVTNASSATKARIYPIQADNDLTATSGNIYIQDAQLEQGLVARSYNETTTSAFEGGITDNVPRLDYSGGATCPSILLEPQRTNAVSQSEYLNAIWGKTSVSVTSNAAVSPEGVQNAAKLVEANASSFHFIVFGTTINAEPTTFSFYAKAAERTSVSAFLSQSGNVGAIFDLSAETATASGTGNTASIESVGNDWYRCVVTNDGSADLNDSVRIGIQNGALNSYQGDGTSGVYIWGAQLEINASYPTSYIPTYGSAVTRNQDEFSIANQPQLFGDSEGTLFIDRSALGIYDDYSNISLNSGNFTNSLGIRYNPNGNSILAQCRVNNANEAFLNHSVTDITDRSKAAFGYKTNDFVFYVDGSSVGTETSGNTFPDGTITHMKSSRGDADDFFYGRIYQILVFTTRLTNAELADLTTL